MRPLSLAVISLAVSAATAQDLVTERIYDLSDLFPIPCEDLVGVQPMGLAEFDPVDRVRPSVLNLSGDYDDSDSVLRYYLQEALTAEGAIPLELDGGELVVTADAASHARVARLLTVLRGWQAHTATLRLSVVVGQSAPPALGVTDAQALAGFSERYRLRLRLRPGVSCAQGQLRRATYVAGYECDEKGLAPTLAPRIAELLLGGRARAWGTFLGDGALRVDLELDTNELSGPLGSAAWGGGAIDLPQLAGLRLGASFRARVGELHVLGVARAPGGETALVVGELEALTPAPEPAHAKELQLRTYDMASDVLRTDLRRGTASTALYSELWAVDSSRGSGFSFEAEEPDHRRELSDLILGEQLRLGIDPQTVDATTTVLRDSVVLVVGDRQRQEAVARVLRARLEQPRVAYCLVTAVVEDAPAEARLDEAGFASLREAAEGLVSVPGRSGQGVQLRVGGQRAYVAGRHRVSGGTGEVIRYAVIPQVQSLAHGLELRVRGTAELGGALRLEVEASLRDPAALRVHASPEGEIATVEPQRQTVVRQTLRLKRGEAAVLADEPLPDGRRRVLALQLR